MRDALMNLLIVALVAPIAIPLGAGMAIGLFWSAITVSGMIVGV